MEEKDKKDNNFGKDGGKSAKSSNAALWWILGGCLAFILIGGLLIGGIAFWSYKKIKREVRENRQRFEQAQKQAENSASGAGRGTTNNPTNADQGTSIPEEPDVVQNSGNSDVPSGIYSTAVTEKAIGYLKKVYAKSGKNYIDIDYVQWLTGAAAEKAMREDGQCPKMGECIVYDDYYIRNVNPLVRTFEVSQEAEIQAHDFTADYSSGNWNESWTFSRFSQYFNTNAKNGYWDYAPFHVEIGNNQVLKITEQYTP